MRWDLNNIFPSFADESFLDALQYLKSSIQKFLSWQRENLTNFEDAQQKLVYCIDKFNEISLLATRLMTYANLKLSEDTNNSEALKYLNIIREKFVDLSFAKVIFARYLKDLPLDSFTHPTLVAHKFVLNEAKARAKYLLTDGEERILSMFRITGGEAWNQLTSKITANLMCEVQIEGEKKILPLTVVRNLAYDPRKEIRKAAYEAELKACETIAEVVAFSLNSIKGEFLWEIKLRAFESPIEPMLLENRISFETFQVMITSVENFLPILREYLKLKAKLLGYENGLPWYDLFAPIGSFTKKWSFDEARKLIVEKLSTFSEELGKFTDLAFEKNWIDAEPRKGKRGGAFCSSIKAIKESRILMTFEGHLDNVLTLTHELGHAFHNECLKDETPLNSTVPMVMAETASIFNETLMMEYLKSENLTREERLSLIDKELSDA
ncbi:MAG: M3 family metallopeptidase, partial [Pseudothermotoga sp.]